MKMINVTVVRSYLEAVGKQISNLEQLTQAEASSFAEELCHKTGAAKASVLAALGNAYLLPKYVLDHIQDVLEASGNVTAPNAAAERAAKDTAIAEAKAVSAKVAAAEAKKAEDDAAVAAAKKAADDAKAIADAADAKAMADAQAEDDAAAALADSTKE